MNRYSQVERKTNETDITVKLIINGEGEFSGTSGVGFFDHMLTSFARHGNFDINLKCTGDLHIDGHHTIEDIGIVTGQAFTKACGDFKGIKRFSDVIMPMDEALTLSAIDIGGRGFLHYDIPLPTLKVGDFDVQLVKEFFLAFTRNFPINLHLKLFHGENTHHIIESVFKGTAVALRKALKITNNKIPSSKGKII